MGFKRGLRACFEKGDGRIKDELWEIYKLTDFVNVIDGDRGNNYPKKEQMSKDGETLFLSASNITKNGFNKDDCNFISNEQSNKMSKGVVLPGDIVITSRGTVGNVAYFKDLYGFKNIRINSGMLILRVKDLELAPSIYQYLKSPQFTRNLELITSGSAQPQLTKSDVNKIKINSFNGGIKNAKNGILLSLIDDLIAHNEERLQTRELMKQSYMKQVFNENVLLRHGYNESSYHKVLLGDICNISTGNKDAKDSIEDGDYPFYIRSKKINRINSYSFDGEAVLIGGDGNISDLIHYADGKFDYHQRVYKLSNFTNDTKYMYYYLAENIGKELMRNSANTTVDSVRMPTLSNFKMIIPINVLDQKKISDMLSTIDENINLINERVNNLKVMKQHYLNIIFK